MSNFKVYVEIISSYYVYKYYAIFVFIWISPHIKKISFSYKLNSHSNSKSILFIRTLFTERVFLIKQKQPYHVKSLNSKTISAYEETVYIN